MKQRTLGNSVGVPDSSRASISTLFAGLKVGIGFRVTTSFSVNKMVRSVGSRVVCSGDPVDTCCVKVEVVFGWTVLVLASKGTLVSAVV